MPSSSKLLVGLLAVAPGDNRRVLDDRVAAIRELHAESVKQQAMQVTRRADLVALNAEFARMLGRYRELRGTTPAAGTVPPPAAAAATAGAQ